MLVVKLTTLPSASAITRWLVDGPSGAAVVDSASMPEPDGLPGSAMPSERVGSIRAERAAM